MDLALPDVALQFADAAEQALSSLGHVEAARRAQADPGLRVSEVKVALDALGLFDIDPRVDLDAALMAAEVVRVGGRYVVPFPVVAYAMATPDAPIPVALAGADPLRVDHGDLFADWLVYDINGADSGVAGSRATPDAAPLATRLAPFCTDLVRHGEAVAIPVGEVELLCVLWSSYLLGVAEHAVELAVEHVKGRVQFGRPLSDLQAVRFQVADATIAVDGLRELVRFGLWRVMTDPGHSRGDALATRLAAHEVTLSTLRVAQQLHGASGLCDEYDISVLVRHVQPALRLPLGSDALSDLLFETITTEGFATLFPLHNPQRQ